MNVNLGIWDKLTKAVVGLLLVAGALGVSIWYLPNIRQNEMMRKEILRLDRELQLANETERQLENSLKAMREPRTVERLARETLGYARPGETIIYFEGVHSNRFRTVSLPAR